MSLQVRIRSVNELDRTLTQTCKCVIPLKGKSDSIHLFHLPGYIAA